MWKLWNSEETGLSCKNDKHFNQEVKGIDWDNTSYVCILTGLSQYSLLINPSLFIFHVINNYNSKNLRTYLAWIVNNCPKILAAILPDSQKCGFLRVGFYCNL